MRYVFFSFRPTIVIGLIFLLGACGTYELGLRDFRSLFCGFVVFLIFLYFLFLNFVPYFSYSENGVEINDYFMKAALRKRGRSNFFKWEEIKRVTKLSWAWPGGNWFLCEGGFEFSINGFLTRDYPKVLADLIWYLKKNNSKAVISEELVRIAKKYLAAEGREF